MPNGSIVALRNRFPELHNGEPLENSVHLTEYLTSNAITNEDLELKIIRQENQPLF